MIRLLSPFFLLALALFVGSLLGAPPPQDDAVGVGRTSCYGTDSSGQNIEIRCPDGHFYSSNGQVQPDSCSNAMFNKDGTRNEHAHDCKCAMATTDADHCPPGGLAR